ncbi:MAG: regulatory protein RecX [Planctomycetota bacterium]|jgi:regulatory protein
MSIEISSTQEDALDLLNKRAMSAGKLRRKLGTRGHEHEAIERAIQALERVGVIDDEAMAREYVERVLEKEPAWRAWLTAKLISREIEEPTASRIVEEVLSGHSEGELIRRAIRGRLASMPASLSRESRYRRLGAYLSRRGFSEEGVTDALRDTLGTVSEGMSEDAGL